MDGLLVLLDPSDPIRPEVFWRRPQVKFMPQLLLWQRLTALPTVLMILFCLFLILQPRYSLRSRRSETLTPPLSR